MQQAGFNDVYQLQGGILKYFEDTPANKWNGSCFVFDDRVALNANLKAITDLHCGICNKDLGTDDIRRSDLADQKICIQCGKNG